MTTETKISEDTFSVPNTPEAVRDQLVKILEQRAQANRHKLQTVHGNQKATIGIIGPPGSVFLKGLLLALKKHPDLFHGERVAVYWHDHHGKIQSDLVRKLYRAGIASLYEVPAEIPKSSLVAESLFTQGLQLRLPALHVRHAIDPRGKIVGTRLNRRVDLGNSTAGECDIAASLLYAGSLDPELVPNPLSSHGTAAKVISLSAAGRGSIEEKQRAPLFRPAADVIVLHPHAPARRGNIARNHILKRLYHGLLPHFRKR